MAKMVTVYNSGRTDFEPVDMSYIRWLKISEALARLGHQVDIATNEPAWQRHESPIHMNPNLRRVPLSKIRWSDYDVVKTLFHIGFDSLETYGGSDHPFIISKLGSVVGPEDMEGIYFYGKIREKMYSTQTKISQRSNYVTLLSRSAKELWNRCFGPKYNILVAPGGVDRHVPPPRKDPYPKDRRAKCIFAGNVYTKDSQPEANTVLINKLNKLGKLLSEHDARLYVLGTGDVRRLDERYVTYLGIVSYEKTWDFFYFAQVGVVVSAGKFMHNNESSKIYHYLRAGLPAVSESGFPNDRVIEDAKLGFVVENGNLELMAQKIEEAANKDWNREFAIEYILHHHTWDKRVEIYDKVIKEDFNN
jgi:glycosyltransferase involved in cell wall biosynthesis